MGLGAPRKAKPNCGGGPKSYVATAYTLPLGPRRWNGEWLGRYSSPHSALLYLEGSISVSLHAVVMYGTAMSFRRSFWVCWLWPRFCHRTRWSESPRESASLSLSSSSSPLRKPPPLASIHCHPIHGASSSGAFCFTWRMDHAEMAPTKRLTGLVMQRRFS